MRSGVRVGVTLGVALLVASLLERVGTPSSEAAAAAEAEVDRAQEPTRRAIKIAVLQPEPAPPEPAAQTSPRPKPEARSETPRPPLPEPAPQVRAPAPAPPPSAALPTPLERGRALLRAGRFPRLRATYARIGFPAYRDAMSALGGRFFLYDPAERRTLAEIDPRSGRVRQGAATGELSRWPRDVTRHLDFALRDAPPELAAHATRVILLPPADVDAALLGAVARHVGALGLDPDGIVRLDLAYELHDGRLRAEVITVATHDGVETSLSLAIDLDQPGRRT